MKRFFFARLSAVVLTVVLTCLFAFTDPPPVSKCWNKYKTPGDSNGDACVSQSCVFKTNVSFAGAEWVNCGSVN